MGWGRMMKVEVERKGIKERTRQKSLREENKNNVACCVLVIDEEYECDIARQIHFTLIQAFFFAFDINIVRVNDIERLASIVGIDESEESKDVHCILITSPNVDSWKDPALDKLRLFCKESRGMYEWVPTITLPER
ncbi:growth arrest and DNA damage-inducible protein GADD45 gamma-like [Alosa alosa]|uniref:growth arrest and DNA damage-inducible protein GADD45 gamma-like n=1 Tax=Alosa alosa TaxID=278164 RepID=UPI0020150904|nr:growth arrest and DNA damage-inducible protein GADD45 gamma-like [Alosa alosa]